MDIASCMTRDPLNLGPDATAAQALALLDEAGVRHLPVVEDGALVGIVSDRDLLERTGRGLLGEQNGGDERLAEFMHKDPVTAAPDDFIVSAVSELSVHGIGCLPVVDEGRLVGIVSETDFMRLLVQVAELGLAPAGADPEVREVAAMEVESVAPTATIEVAAERMGARGIRHLAILDDAGEPQGVLSDRDLRRARGASLAPTTQVEALERSGAVEPVLRSDAKLSAAAREMLANKVDAALIQGDGELGIVTTTDILEHALGALS